MDFTLLYKRLIQLLTRPATFWSVVKEEQRSIRDIRRSVLLPLASLIAIASFIGTYRYTYNSLSIVYPLLKAIEYFLIFITTVEVVTLILGEISGFLLKTQLYDIIYKLIIYSFIPFMLLMILSLLFSSLLFLNILGFYGLFILWKGIDILIGEDHNFRIRLFALFASCFIVFYLGIRWIIDKIIEGFYLFIFG